MGGLLVLALLAALIVPPFVDWSAYRADFEREAGTILGRKVEVAGEASARLLPFPSVTFTDVRVAGASDGEPFLTIDAFEMNAELAPYLSGEIRIFAMALTNPVLRLGAAGTNLALPAIPTNADVVLEDVRIDNGSVVFATESDIAGAGLGRIAAIDANLSAESLSGPFEGSGHFDLGGEELSFDLGSGQLSGTGMPLDLSIADADRSTSARIDGRIVSEDGISRFEGRLSFARTAPARENEAAETQPFEALEAAPEVEAPPEGDAMALRAGGSVLVTASLLRSRDLRLEAGDPRDPYVLSGNGEISLQGIAPTFRLTLEGETFDVDRRLGEDESETTGTGGEPRDLADRLEAMRGALAKIPRPPIDGLIELTLPVVTFGDTTIRSLGFEASPAQAGWTVEDLSAELPGRTLVEADGLLRLDPALGFAGNLLVASRQPSGFSEWLSGSVDPAIRALPSAGFSANVDLSAGLQRFADLELRLGRDVLNGMIERVPSTAGGRLTARLAGDAVDLEALRSIGTLATGSPEALGRVRRYDVSLNAGPVRFGEIAADKVDVDLLYDGDVLAIARLDVDGLAGASFTATGELRELGANAAGEIELTLDADDPERFLAFVDRIRPGLPIVAALRAQAPTFAPVKLSGEIQSIDRGADSATLLLRLDGTAAGTGIDFSSAIENGFKAMETSGRVGIDIRLENEAPSVLLAQLGLPAKRAAIAGPLEIEASISASARGPAVVSASLYTPQTEGNLESVLELTDAGLGKVDSSVRLASQSLGPWIDGLGLDLGLDPEMRRTLGADLTGQIAYGDGGWRLSDLSGQLGGLAVRGDIALADDGAISGSVRSDYVSLPWLASLAYGADPLTGANAWSSVPFARSRLPDRSLALEVTADRLDAGPAEIDDASFSLESSERQMTLSDLSGDLDGGTLGGSVTFRNLEGLGSVSAELRADALALGTLAPGLVLEGPGGSLDLSARLDASGQSAAALISGLAGAGEIVATRFAIPTIPSDPLPELLKRADAEGFSADTGTAQAFDEVARGAAFEVDRLASDYVVSGGEAVLSPVVVSAEGSDLTIAGRIDLADLGVSGDLRLELDPGDEAVEGAEPVVRYGIDGSLASPRLSRSDTALANFLAVRALEREQARVEAMQDRLEETLRLRRETRFFRWLDRREAEAAEAARAEAERRATALREAEEARRREAVEAAEAREAERQRRALPDEPIPANRPPVERPQAGGENRGLTLDFGEGTGADLGDTLSPPADPFDPQRF